jgi:hypothetical protein
MEAWFVGWTDRLMDVLMVGLMDYTFGVKSSLPTRCKFHPRFICMTLEVQGRCGHTDELEGGGELSKVFTVHTEGPSCT